MSRPQSTSLFQDLAWATLAARERLRGMAGSFVRAARSSTRLPIRALGSARSVASNLRVAASPQTLFSFARAIRAFSSQSDEHRLWALLALSMALSVAYCGLMLSPLPMPTPPLGWMPPSYSPEFYSESIESSDIALCSSADPAPAPSSPQAARREPSQAAGLAPLFVGLRDWRLCKQALASLGTRGAVERDAFALRHGRGDPSWTKQRREALREFSAPTPLALILVVFWSFWTAFRVFFFVFCVDCALIRLRAGLTGGFLAGFSPPRKTLLVLCAVISFVFAIGFGARAALFVPGLQEPAARFIAGGLCERACVNQLALDPLDPKHVFGAGKFFDPAPLRLWAAIPTANSRGAILTAAPREPTPAEFKSHGDYRVADLGLWTGRELLSPDAAALVSKKAPGLAGEDLRLTIESVRGLPLRTSRPADAFGDGFAVFSLSYVWIAGGGLIALGVFILIRRSKNRLRAKLAAMAEEGQQVALARHEQAALAGVLKKARGASKAADCAPPRRPKRL